MKTTFTFLAMALLSLAAFANGIRVDINQNNLRQDALTRRCYNWTFIDGKTASFKAKGITSTLRLGSGSKGTGLVGGFAKALLYTPSLDDNEWGATMTSDGVTVDGTTTGGIMELVLSGLSTGKHSLITYHSFWSSGTYSTMQVLVNGTVVKSGVKPTIGAKSDTSATKVYMEFTATSGTDVVIRFKAEGNGTIDNVVLNAFEIDGVNPAKAISNPRPKDGQYHWEQGNGLKWTSASGAVSHDLYLGTDSSKVVSATTASSEYKGNKTSTSYSLSNLSTLEMYWYRVDEKFSDGTVVKGNVMSFRTARLSFPTAEGYGRYARGGRGGRIIEVTNLNDAGTGSLRDALEVQKGPRIVVFRVGGTILLNSRISIPNDGGDVYVAGQTAPGDGICIARYACGALGATDVIFRFLRNRVGDYPGVAMDGMGMGSCDHSIIDHCSISWTTDEGTSSRYGHHISFQHNIISECLNNSVHYLDGGTSGNDDSQTQRHSFAGSVSGKVGSYHHNLLCHCTGRNWSMAGGMEPDVKHYGGALDVNNNVIYNWTTRTTDGEVGFINFVNNYYKAGPSTTLLRVFELDVDQLGTGFPCQAYLSGNKMTSYSGSVLLSPSADSWTSATTNYGTVAQAKSTKPLYPSYITLETADNAYASVVTKGNVGATYPKQDAIDTRILKDVRNNTYTYTGSKDHIKGIIDSQNDVGGYPTLKGGTAPTDTDHDGMPDTWEKAHGLNPNSQDHNGDRDYDGYTNIEEYLSCLVGESTTCNTIVTDLEETDAMTITNGVVCYPNPFHESFSLKAVGAFHYVVYDLKGVEMEKGTGEGSVALGTGLSAGLYVVKVETAQGTQFVKVTKK